MQRAEHFRSCLFRYFCGLQGAADAPVAAVDGVTEGRANAASPAVSALLLNGRAFNTVAPHQPAIATSSTASADPIITEFTNTNGHSGCEATRSTADKVTSEATRQLANQNEPVSVAQSAELSQVAMIPEDIDAETAAAFPKGHVDVNGQQVSCLALQQLKIATIFAIRTGSCTMHSFGLSKVDLRSRNSWLMKLGEISTGEAAEVLAINTLAPFVLNGKLRKSLTQPRCNVAALTVLSIRR